MQYYDYFMYSVYPCFWVTFSLLNLIVGYMWTDVSECLCRLYLCLIALFVEAKYVEANSRPVPGWRGRFSVAPMQVEQPEPLVPWCGYCWLQGSMMSYEYSKTPFLSLLLLCWYFIVELFRINTPFLGTTQAIVLTIATAGNTY